MAENYVDPNYAEKEKNLDTGSSSQGGETVIDDPELPPISN